MLRVRAGFVLVFFSVLSFASAQVFARDVEARFTLEQILSYPYPGDLVAAEDGNRIAWVINQEGVRNIWVAQGPDFEPRQLTHYTRDSGQALSQLEFSPGGEYVVYVRGGDHHANWPAEGNLAPNPASRAEEPKVTIWSVPLAGGKPVKIAEGDHPAISPEGKLAFVKQKDVWTASLDGEGKPERLFFDRGRPRALRWSPDGSMLAFVSGRDDHSFIGIFRSQDKPIQYLLPSTHRDFSPRWSPNSRHIAFARRPGRGGPPEPILERTPEPWSLWVANVANGEGHVVWESPHTLKGSVPGTLGGVNLYWTAGDRLVFLADLDGWPHLYSIPVSGAGEPLLLTPGEFMVEYVTLGPERTHLVYNANTGETSHDYGRRHLFRVPVDAPEPVALTAGTTIEWAPAVTGSGAHVAYISAGAKRPPLICIATLAEDRRRCINEAQIPADYPTDQLVVPRPVSFESTDGLTIHGQLFQAGATDKPEPGIIFLHGGPPRQMLLGWHYSGYYSNAYAVNQYLATHGFTVLSVNYRLGIGYGHEFHYPADWGPTGASEYRDVVAGGRFLQQVEGVDPDRIGLWGGSYGGYLTALGLARDSDLFKAGVDLHGVHDWSQLLPGWFGKPDGRYEKGDFKKAMEVAFKSSPVADMETWESPVLVIQGDDDRNVRFHQMVDLVRRLKAHDIPFEQIVYPNEVHGFLLHETWVDADKATVNYFREQFLKE